MIKHFLEYIEKCFETASIIEACGMDNYLLSSESMGCNRFHPGVLFPDFLTLARHICCIIFHLHQISIYGLPGLCSKTDQHVINHM